MRTRVGKIARLPAAIRGEINRRLHNGALGKNIVPWLNALPDVKHIVAEQFAGQPISKNNLSEWRRGGFKDWLLDRERRARLNELASANPGQSDGQLDALMLERIVRELAEELERLAVMTDGAERFKRLVRLSREMCRLQRIRTRDLEVSLFEAKAHETIPALAAPMRDLSHLLAPFSTKDMGGGGWKMNENP